TGFYGFSWTTLFFGAFPALFRKDFITFIGTFIVLIILAFLTMGIGSTIGMIIWAFMYNKYYTTNLIKKGFAFSGTNTENELASGKLNLRLNADNCLTYRIGN
ncbi:hypothetical protein QB691_002537, partial [Escherichia coli]|nr:hypothetical protein [Escherichia coli]